MKKFIVLFLFHIAVLTTVSAAQPLMRISVENTDAHVQTQAVRAFAEDISRRLEGIVEVEFYSSASLFRDSDVVRAMAQAKLEMAVPGTWQLGSLVPETGIFLLPSFYGSSAELVYQYLASPAGKQIISLIEQDLLVHVPGSWMDLGYTHLFSTQRQIRSYLDIAGMPVRVAGGTGNESRISAMGGRPITIAWPDVPRSLQQGLVTGLLTSYESVRSAALWEFGVLYAFEDNQYFAQYVPMISRPFWDSLTAEAQRIITDSWEEAAAAQRIAAEQAQRSAKEAALANGILISIPRQEVSASMRDVLKGRELRIAEQMRISSEYVVDLERFMSTYSAE